MKEAPLLQVEGLVKEYAVKSQKLLAISRVDFVLYPGETLGLVGESGCGKSTVGKCLIGLEKPTRGKISFCGQNISSLKSFHREVAVIFQDPYSSLNPRMTAKELIAEPLIIHKIAKGSLRDQRVEELLQLVGIPLDALTRFPHEFSGGQRQRISIARSLASNPRLLVCDEPVSALDVSVQAQIINLLKTMQKNSGLSMLFIAHDLRVVKYLSHRVAVMYLGSFMEVAPSEELYKNPLHPYTQALLSAIPIPDPHIEKKRSRLVLTGEVPSPLHPPKGCPFVTRCPKAMALCKEKKPPLIQIGTNHQVACHLVQAKVSLNQGWDSGAIYP